MPKYNVYVQRLVPQWRTVVVECDDASDIECSVDVQEEIFDAASQLTGWEYDDDSPSSFEPSKVLVVGTTDEDPEVQIHNPEAR